METRLSRLLFFLVILLTTACAKELTPQEVADRFWTAIEQNDAREVKRHITAADAANLASLDDVLPVTDTELKRTIIEEQAASIETQVKIGGDKPLEFPLNTYLVLENERWKVDYERTVSAIGSAGKLAAVIQKVHEFGDALHEGIDRSVKELEQTLPQIERELSRIEGQIKQHVPELRRRLEKFTQELEEAIKRPQEKPAQENEGTVQI